ncbi:hypothetical protein [Paenibacillus agilis]|uniref:Uncharacterized protein n=1 Tax=Paenibacillus agilis TaxID=3020863 RepID=A0A559IZM1_9BACL|nr:hypothetical protein [Paenibacillus agilis]TVX93070.1 hypothetical protein FPZ44_08355 [Paenibacillus agilis]
MDPTLSYIGLSVLDALAVNLLILKLYRLPVRKYIFQILIFCGIIAIVSFTMRIAVGQPEWDLPIQFVLFLLFYRYTLKYRMHLSAFILGSGWSAYISLQMIIYHLTSWAGLSNNTVIFDTAGLSVYIIQISSITVALLISLFLWVTGRGFSFILVPPHDFFFKENYAEYGNRVAIISAAISTVTIFVTLALLFAQLYIGIMVLSLVTFVTAYYFSDRSEAENARKAIAQYRNKSY